MDFSSTNFLNDLLAFFQQHSVMGMLALQPYAQQLIFVLAIIDLCTTWSLYDGELRMSAMTSKVIKVGFFIFLIIYWDQLNSAILQSFQYAGLTAAGVPISSTELIRPSGILDLGFQATGELLEDFHKTSIMSDGGLGKCTMDLASVVITLGAFFFMALQVLLTKIEFNIFASLGVILLPFGALRYTSFLFQRVVSSVFSFGVKLMVMFFILGLFNALTGDIKAISATTDFSIMLKISLSYAALAYITWKLPDLISGMMNGQPAMDGGGAIAGAAMTAGAAAVGAATGGVGGIAAKAASTVGNAKATMNAARTSQSQNGGSMAGNFAKTMARQKFANSTIGKSLIRGANNAIGHSEDYNNIRSGEAFKTQQSNRNDNK